MNEDFESKIKNIFPESYDNINSKFVLSDFENFEEFFFYEIQEYFLFENIEKGITEERMKEIREVFKDFSD
jgi:hypothetical protein